MAKSTVDLTIWLDDLSDELATKKKLNKLPFLSLEIFSDKSFRISEHKEGVEETEILLMSEDMDNGHCGVDINDLLYVLPEVIANRIISDQSVKDIKADEL